MRSPELAQAEQRVSVMRARVPQAGALPDPTLMSGVMNEGRPVPFDTLGTAGFSEVYLGISQEVPFPGKRRLREEVASEEASAQAQSHEATRRRVVVEVAEGYYELRAARAVRESVERNLELLDRLARATRERFAVGQANQQDVLDADVELTRLEERRLALEQRERLAGTALARLLARSEPVELGPLVPLVRHEEAIRVPSSPSEPAGLGGTLEELLADAEEASPLLREQRERVQAASRRLELARRDLLPDLGLEFVYHDRGRRELDPFYTIGWTMTLPVYANRKQKQAIEEAAAEVGAARSAANAARAQIRHDVTSAHLQVTTADRMLRLYEEGLLRQGRLVLDSAIAQYQVGKLDFQTVISSWRRLLEDEINYSEQLAARESAAAQLALHLGRSPLLSIAGLAESRP